MVLPRGEQRGSNCKEAPTSKPRLRPRDPRAGNGGMRRREVGCLAGARAAPLVARGIEAGGRDARGSVNESPMEGHRHRQGISRLEKVTYSVNRMKITGLKQG